MALNPSHIGLEGNEVASGLAVEGMCHSPLWSVVRGKTVRVPRVGVTGGRGAESQTEASSESGSDVVSVGLADFEEELPQTKGHSTDCVSTYSLGLSEPMPPQDHSLYSDLMHGYLHAAEGVSEPSTEASNGEGYTARNLAWRMLGSRGSQ